MMGKRVVVAMSGGVDSSTALAILKEKGFDCIGVSMQLWDRSEKESSTGGIAGSCCSLEDLYDARMVAEGLGVPYYVLNLEEAFSKEVVDYFVLSYLKGETPNPCIKCNEVVKFRVLLKKALALDADFLATGHYARIERTEGGPRLLKGVDETKDQSYFLFTMRKEEMERVLFPLGSMSKKEVRRIARRFGLKTSEKEESQEICFVTGSYGEFMAERLGLASSSGEIVDTEGRTLGVHRGLFNYTVGQRKGLGLSGGPYYVLGMEREANRLIVGPEEKLYSKGLIAREVNWIDPGAEELAKGKGVRVTVKIRYRHPGAEATVTATGDGRIKVAFDGPEKAVTPGQAAVLYRGQEVLGGGWIEEAL